MILGIPVYLDNLRVYDLLAEFDDGFYHLETIKTASREADAVNANLKGHAGISNLLSSFVNIGFEAERGTQKHDESGREITHQRIHTPTSLFAKVRQRLTDKNMIQNIKTDSDLIQCNQGDFVEFKATIQINPYLRRLQRYLQHENLNAGFNAIERDDLSEADKKLRTQLNNATHALIEKAIETLRQDDYVEIIGNIRNTKIHVVTAANLKYFIDNYQTQINNGQFTVLGKVIRVLPREKDGKIDLLRNVPLGQNELNFIEDHIKLLEERRVEFPSTETEIKAPAIQVFPIAIFV